MSRPALWQIGDRLPCGVHDITQGAIVDFASVLDPQPMHLDGASEQAAMMGGLISSGWQTVAINHAMARKALLDAAGYAHLLRVDTLRWSAPVRPGDRLTGTAEVCALDEAAGTVMLRHILINQSGETVMGLEAHYARHADTARDPDHGPYPTGDRPVHPVPFEQVTPGTVTFAGEHTFSHEAAAQYRALYDPARGDEAETVAPWQVTAQWLRLNVDRWNALEAQEIVLPQRGPGLGLQDVIWPTPARVGQPLRYFTRTLSTRASSSRRGWGIISNRNYALDATGAVVMAFTSAALLEGSAP